MTEVSISTLHHRLRGYVVRPEGEGPWPGVIVLHDIFGLTDVTREHADWLAKEGKTPLRALPSATSNKVDQSWDKTSN